MAAPSRLRVEYIEHEQIAWEVFRGHLLDTAHVRVRESFEAWHVFVDDADSEAAAPLLSIRFQHQENRVHVTRQILSYGFEAYEEPPGVILTREVEKWISELVVTLQLGSLSQETLISEFSNYLFLAVTGTSRLPITSLESPLPSFSLGRFAYLPGLGGVEECWSDPIEFFQAALGGPRNAIQQAKALEVALRASPVDRLPRLVELLSRFGATEPDPVDWVVKLVRTLFNNVALSPYTEFADRLISLVLIAAERGPFDAGAAADLLGYMLRHLSRHLTAFDLTLFHNFGANYPDALFLDALVKAFLHLLGTRPDLFVGGASDGPDWARRQKLRRRALRQAVVLRKQYEGHRVPDVPTSIGENARVLPVPFARVAEEQLSQASKRTRRLFDGEPLEGLLSERGRQVLSAAVADFLDPDELRELGTATFLDRPLGLLKQPGEIDRTPLLAYEAFSRLFANRRLRALRSTGFIDLSQLEQYTARLQDLAPPGIRASDLSTIERAGVVSLLDANKAASDFVLLRTTRQSLAELFSHYDLRPLRAICTQIFEWLTSHEPILLLPRFEPLGSFESAKLILYDRRGVPRLELGIDARQGLPIYREHQGVELATRLHVLKACYLDSENRLIERTFEQDAVCLKIRDMHPADPKSESVTWGKY